MKNALRLARHEWMLVFRDPRFFIPFAVVPLLLIALHGAALFLFAGNPWQGWMLTRTFLAVLSLIGASLAVPLGADAFAGEKERRTWETLLCLPLPRRQLFAGKVLGALPFPLAVGWLGQGLALGLAGYAGGLQTAAPMEWVFPLLLTPFLSLFFCALSVLISLQCETVRGAAQLTGLSLLILFPAVTVASQMLAANPLHVAYVLITMSAGAMGCFALAARRLGKT
jgi:ABC-2 type transport system permease protein